MVFLAVWRYGDDARWCANDKSAADHLSFHIRQTILHCTISYRAICRLILNNIILYDSIPYNLSFDTKQTAPYYTTPHHTITYRMVPFVFWYQTARIWRIWQGPQRPVGILTPSTKYKTTSSTCVSACDQVKEEEKTIFFCFYFSARIRQICFITIATHMKLAKKFKDRAHVKKKGCQQGWKPRRQPFALIHQLIGCCHVHLFIAGKTVEIALEKGQLSRIIGKPALMIHSFYIN